MPNRVCVLLLEEAEAEAQGGKERKAIQVEPTAEATPGQLAPIPGFFLPTSSPVRAAQGSEKAP